MARTVTGRELAAIVLSRATSTPTALVFDFDGTIARITPRPEQSILESNVRIAIERLAKSPAFRVGIVSGRSLAGFKACAGEITDVLLAVNGGLRMSDGDAGWTHPDALHAMPEIMRLADQLETTAHSMPGVRIERKGVTLAAHCRSAPGFEASLQKTVESLVQSSLVPLRIVHGKAVFEIQPDIAWNKGRALDAMCDRWGVKESAVYLGDDAIDEPAFEAVQRRGGIGCRVDESPLPTCATHRMLDVDEAHAFLFELASTLD